ncbi:efflux RND transporter permease subunit [Candidatus Methylospira mobilis]|uniref:efflux RND transporter permease subunit n=1 Tax=Candidatus Methylospira mobilis TaxID=1808979 RepID=UPI0028F00F8B|nr:efflux RND transporter permease subunit [Candidatus Methylospira mobilis]WNV05423.1 efflux RND transporter permease subunit [Candidatus Methylospira mobilis]
MSPRVSFNLTWFTKTLKIRLLIGLLIAALAIALSLRWIVFSKSKNGDETVNSATALSVRSINPEQREFSLGLKANGTVEIWQEVIVATEISGSSVTKVLHHVGDHVKKGQLLLVFDDKSLLLEIEQTRAELEQARLSLRDAELKSRAVKQVKETGALSELKIAELAMGEKTSRVRMAAAKAKLDLQLLRLKNTKVVAAEEGVITQQNVKLGSVPSLGADLFHMILKGQLEWLAVIPSEELKEIKPGVTVLLSAAGLPDVRGTVRSISPEVDSKTRQATVFVDMPVLFSNGYRPGMFVQGEFQLGMKLSLAVPSGIRDTIEDNPSIALLDGKPVIAFQIARSKGAGVIEVANQVDQAIRNLRADFPNIHIARITDFVSPVEESFSGSVRMFVEGTFLVIFVVWLFLRNSRATLISALALPLSVLPVFIGMYFLGYTLNLVTLLALSLVIGILVDDAIVEIENIIRYLRIEHSPRTATINATQEIGLAVIATTFAMIAVFFPTAFMKGITGLYFRQFGVTATIAVFSSLAVARLLTPMMSAHLLKLSPEKETRQNNIKMVYLRFVEWCLDHRIWTLVGVLLFFFGSLFLSGFLAKDFMPRIEDPQTQVMIEMAPGAQESEILALSEEVRQKISSIPVVKAVFSVIGAPVSSESGRNSMETYRKATLNVILGPSKDREKSNEEIESEISRLLSRVPGVRIKVGPRGSQRHVFAFQLMSADPHLLSLTARKVEGELKTIPGFGSITSTVSELRPELLIRPDFAKIADLGVSTQDIGDTLRVSTIGDYEAYLPKLNLGQQRIPIALIIKPESLSQIQLVKMLRVPSANSKTGTVELGQVAEVRLTTGVGSINRFNYSRVAKFEVELIGVDLVDAADSVARMRSIQSLPKGITRLDIGDAEELNDLFHGFGFAMLAGVVVIYIIMALLFTDFLQPITILSALPLSFGGGFIALLLTGKALSMPALIGMVMLIGIATKNSILLVDYCIIYKNGRGATFREAIIDACRHRATPIIMTSIAMAVGMLPIAIGTGSSDSEFRSQMAIAVIGGLFTSTFLSLLVVPVVYLTIEDFRSYIMSRFRK